MSDGDTTRDDAAALEEEEEERPPDESTLLGVSGVEAEVLAEAARAEAELREPWLPDDESEGAEV